MKYRNVLRLLVFVMLLSSMYSCQNTCIDEVLLATTKIHISVNDENLGIFPDDNKNAVDTIRSSVRQFFNEPEFRRFSYLHLEKPVYQFFPAAYAGSDCPERIEYISRFDPSKTIFRINVPYDASTLGLGIIPADTNLLDYEALKAAYLADLTDNAFLNGGAPTGISLVKGFFSPINDQWITFYFAFTELDGTIFEDELTAYIEVDL